MVNTTKHAHSEKCRMKIESCLAEDEETKLRLETAKLHVDNWSAKKLRSGDFVSHLALAAAASGSVLMAKSINSADELFGSDTVPDYGVKKARWSLHEQETKESDPNESSVQISSQEHNRRLK